MTAILAIDPGPEHSAWLWFEDGRPDTFGISPNESLLSDCRDYADGNGIVVIEKVEGFGMAVGAEVFETVYWSGRFAEAVQPVPVERIGRKAIKSHLCGSVKAKDSNIRQALIDRFGGAAAIGTTKARGPLYGISKDVWSALAIAVTYADGAR